MSGRSKPSRNSCQRFTWKTAVEMQMIEVVVADDFKTSGS